MNLIPLLNPFIVVIIIVQKNICAVFSVFYFRNWNVLLFGPQISSNILY